MPDMYIWLILCFVGPFVFIAVVWPRIIGWHALAKRYRTRECHEGLSFSFATLLRFGGLCGYMNCISVRVGEQGLRIALSPPSSLLLGLGHPPLFIPWTAIASCERKQRMFGSVTILQIKDPNVTLAIGSLWGPLSETIHQIWELRQEAEKLGKAGAAPG